MTRVKVCGITNLEDAMSAVQLGADALGFVFADSPRRVSPLSARKIISGLPPFVARVGVFVNESLSVVRDIFDYCRLTAVQLHGFESQDYLNSLACPVIKSFRVKDYTVLDQIRAYDLPYFLLDTYDNGNIGGTGKSFDWAIARRATGLGSVILSGGLTHENVGLALQSVRPYGVDVGSGVEASPGKKDVIKLERFIAEVRNWNSQTD